MFLNPSPAVTHYLTENPEHWQVKSAKKNNHDVLLLDWLLEVADSGELIQPRPHHYVHLTKATRTSNPAMDRFGDL